MKQLQQKILFILFIFFAPACFAWDSSGHRLIAQIAYERLTPAAQKKVDQMTGLLDENFPAQSRFLYASTWPDRIRGDDVNAFNRWHYIDNPYSIDGTPTRFPSRENVVWAVYQAEQVLQSPKANRYEKAVFLQFLIHFVGDAHQPLHCAELYSQQFPHGDRNGNDYLIKDNNVQNLHEFWDEGVGFFRADGKDYPLTNAEVKKLANQITISYPVSYFGNKANDLNPGDWSKESYQLAIDVAYKTPENSAPSPDYITTGQKIAAQQIALAGYRLANLLNKILS